MANEARYEDLVRKLKNEMANESRLMKSGLTSFEIGSKFLEDCWNFVINNIKAEHPDYDERQVLEEIRAQNAIEIKMRNKIHEIKKVKSSNAKCN